MMYILIVSFIGYLLGSVNPAIILSRFIYREDIRNTGSGNPGATNAVRVYGKKFGIAVFLCDFSKGLLAVAAARIIISITGAPYAAILAAGFFAQLGHILPVFHKFRGGKGVATAVGAAFGVVPLAAAILLVLFAVILVTTKYVSLASGICAALYPILAYFMSNTQATANCVFAASCAMLILIRHISNFERLSKGEEGKIK